MKKDNQNRNRCLKHTEYIGVKSYRRYKMRENRKGVINHIRRDRKLLNCINDDLN
jgi:hypothetical protein